MSASGSGGGSGGVAASAIAGLVDDIGQLPVRLGRSCRPAPRASPRPPRAPAAAIALDQARVAPAPLVRRLDCERPAGGLDGIADPSARGSDVGEMVVHDGCLGRPPEDDERLRPAAEGRIVIGVERQGAVEGLEGSRRVAQPKLDAAEGRSRHGAVGGDRDRLAVGDSGVFETAPQDRHVAGPKGLLVPLEERLGHRCRLPDREEGAHRGAPGVFAGHPRRPPGQRFVYCGALRARLRPYFLRSFIRGSRVRKPAWRSGSR